MLLTPLVLFASVCWLPASTSNLAGWAADPRACEYEVAGVEVPSIFTKPNCFGTLKMPGKPPPYVPPVASIGPGFNGVRPPPGPEPKCLDTPTDETVVSSQGALKAALSSAKPGSLITVQPGKYTFGTLAVSGTADAPICIVAETPAVLVDTSGGHAVAAEGSRSETTGKTLVTGKHIVLDGFYAPETSYEAINTDKADGVVIKRFAFMNAGHSGVCTMPGSGNIFIIGNYFESFGGDFVDGVNNGTTGAQTNRTDYGVCIFESGNVQIRYNVFNGMFNHAVSVKKLVASAYIEDNHFYGCGANCGDIGQTPDGHLGFENSSAYASIKRNTYTCAYKEQGSICNGVMIKNMIQVDFEDNVFTNEFEKPIGTRLVTAGGETTSFKSVVGNHSPYTDLLNVINNTFNGGTLEFQGRGRSDDTVVLTNNKGTVNCTLKPFNTNGHPYIDYGSFDTTGPLKAVESGNSFSCSP